MFDITILDVSILMLVMVLFVAIWYSRPRQRSLLPPGPRPWPIIGNILDMPSEHGWVTFAKWGRQYGDICSVTLFGQPMIIVNSAQDAVELMEKRSASNSDRPEMVFAAEMIGWKDSLVLLQPGERFRRYRKFFYSCIGSVSALRKFHPAKEDESSNLLRRLLARPEDLREHLKYCIGSSVMRDAYGYNAKVSNDPYIDTADRATDQFSRATQPPGYLVDYIPTLRYIPDWFPGANFKHEASEWGSTLSDMINQPFDFVKQQIASGVAPISFISELMQSKVMTPSEEFDLKWAAGSLYSGASDTTLSSIYSFFLAMALFPDVQKKAQLELDLVVGSDRLPTYADRSALVYINAIVSEVLRWHSTVPLCIPHRTAQDDMYKGHFIPKGSIIVANIWGINHDENVYHNPTAFNPDRYLNPGRSEPDPRKVTFGFGRRSCPGAHLADANIYLIVATVLAVFDISKPVDNGSTIHPIHANTPGTISHPLPFKCSIQPRSEQASALIQSE